MVSLHGEDDQSIREYRDGDDLRRIHWPATARTGDLMVRQEDRPARRRAVILLDPRASGHQGTGVGSSFEWAVSAVASLLTHLADAGYAVHLVSAESIRSGVVASVAELDTALEMLAEASTSDDRALDELVRAAGTVAATGGLVVAVLADHDDEAFRRVASLRQSGGTGLAVVLDSASFGDGPGAGGAGHDGEARALAELLHLSGWSAVTVRAGGSMASAWAALTTRGLVRR